jgi:single-strand DNA-binding protein
MKNIVIAGRTGKDAELRRLQDGTPVLSFSVAVDDGFGESKKTMWFDCSMFGNRGQALEKHLVKGTPVTVAGDFGKREHEGKTYLQVRVNDVTLQGGKPQSSPAPERQSGIERAPTFEDDGDMIPF